MKILVAIPCLNNGTMVRECVESIVNISGTDLLLIDNGADLDVKDVIYDYGDRHNVKVLANEKNLYVNPAWQQSITYFLNKPVYDYLVILNSDTILNKYWKTILELFYTNFKDCIPLPIFTNDKATKEASVNMGFNAVPVTEGTPGVFICLNRKQAQMVSPLPEYIKIWFGDNFIFEVLRSVGYKTLVVDNLLCYHAWSQTVSKVPNIEQIIEQDKINWAKYSEADKAKRINEIMSQDEKEVN